MFTPFKITWLLARSSDYARFHVMLPQNQRNNRLHSKDLTTQQVVQI